MAFHQPAADQEIKLCHQINDQPSRELTLHRKLPHTVQVRIDKKADFPH